MKNLTQLLFTLFCLCLPAMLQAQDKDDSKYLAASKSPFLLSLALFQLGFAGIRPSALKDLTVVAEGLVALYHCSCLSLIHI